MTIDNPFAFRAAVALLRIIKIGNVQKMMEVNNLAIRQSRRHIRNMNKKKFANKLGRFSQKRIESYVSSDR